MEIDEKTRFREDYVRIKIACRDVMKVPKTVEGTLGLCIHDFIFEREVQEEEIVRKLSSGIIVSGKEPQAKKFKSDDQPKVLQLTGPSNPSGLESNEAGSSKNGQHQKSMHLSNFAPPKMNATLSEKNIEIVGNQNRPSDKAK